MTDAERRDRLAFAIRAAMGSRTAQDVAGSIQPRRSKETIARWARGETVPSALDVGPLADALGVKVELLVNPPAVPSYPLSEYLVEAQPSTEAVTVADVVSRSAGSGVPEGIRRARTDRVLKAPGIPVQSKKRSPRGTGARRV